METIDDAVEGIVIDKEKIGNPKLRKLFRIRERDFIFSYGDGHSDYSAYSDKYSDRVHTDYNDWEDSGGGDG